jgi:hypothetical protein
MSAEQIAALDSDLIVWKDDEGDYRVLLKTVVPNLCIVIKKELIHPASQSDDDVYAAILAVVEQYYAQLLEENE